LLKLILEHADVDAPAGSNCRALRLHKRTALALGLDPRLSRLVLIMSDNSGLIVTVLWADDRRYRRTH
jgi:hypothetical protein